MKSIFTLLAIWSVLAIAQYQNPIQDTVGTYEVEDIAGLRALKIPVNFNQSNPLKSILDSINDLTIQRIDLVYSLNKENPNFDQKSLNKKRINAFTKKFPASKNDLVAWREIAQGSAKSPEEAKELFHGFVIYFRPSPTKASMEKELAYIDEMLGFSDSPKSEETKEALNSTTTETTSESSTTSIETSNSTTEETAVLSDVLLPLIIGAEDGCFEQISMERYCTPIEMKSYIDSLSGTVGYLGGSYSFTSMGGEIEEDEPVKYDVLWYRKIEAEGCESVTPVIGLPITYTMNFDPDYEVVEAVFKRHPKWRRALVVMDVTGSMSPYIGKTMAWLKERAKQDQINAFVFFNDGNMTPDAAKKVGMVGGVYGTKNSSFDAIYTTMKKTMSKGYGGDCPENNVEATLKGIKDYPGSDEIVMVADNWATPRDLSLVKDIGRPVHVILCGSYAGINIDYVQLAYDTKGSVHTIEEDLDMMGVKPGETFNIGGYYYTIIDGKVVTAGNG